MGPKADKIYDRIQWDVDDPNVLRLSVPGGLAINTRVTRRSQQQNGTNRRVEKMLVSVSGASVRGICQARCLLRPGPVLLHHPNSCIGICFSCALSSIPRVRVSGHHT